MKMTLFGKASKWFWIVGFASVFLLGSLEAHGFTNHNVVDNEKWEVICLVYHRFGDSRYPSTNTSVNDFEDQLNWLKKEGYEFVTVSEAYNSSHKEGSKLVCITVDDSYKSFYQNAFPLLKKYHANATLYVNTESVGWDDYCSWAQLKELSDFGIEIGNHSHSHDYFVNKPEGERALYFENDCLLAENLFERHLGNKPGTFAYPFGEFTEDIINVLDKRGYSVALAQNSGVWSESSHKYAIPRFPMSGTMSLKKFIFKVNMKPFRLENDVVGPVLVAQDGGSKDFIFKYDNDKYPGPINCFVDGQNHSVQYIDSGEIKVVVDMPQKRRILVTLTVQDKNHAWCWYSQLLIHSGFD